MRSNRYHPARYFRCGLFRCQVTSESGSGIRASTPRQRCPGRLADRSDVPGNDSGAPVEEVYHRTSSSPGLHLIPYRAMLEVPAELLRYLSRLLARRAAPAGHRHAAPAGHPGGEQAAVLRGSRNRHPRPCEEPSREPGARYRRAHQERAAARPALPRRARVRPTHPALGRPPARHRQPKPNHRDNPRSTRPHPIRAQIHQVKIGEITSLSENL